MSERKKITVHDLRLRIMRKDLHKLLHGNAAFRRFVWTILNEARIFYPAAAGTPHETALSAGRQSLGLEVLHMLKHVEPGILGLIEQEGDLLAAEVGTAAAQLTEEPDDD